jgi:hypothetical protein
MAGGGPDLQLVGLHQHFAPAAFAEEDDEDASANIVEERPTFA